MIEDFATLIPEGMRSESGSVFYSGRDAFSGRSSIYVLGLNPGGNPITQSDETIDWHSRRVLREVPANWSAYRYECWRGRTSGTAGMQPRVLHMIYRLGLDPGSIPASNIIFIRSRHASDIKGRFDQLADACWPFHDAVIENLKPKAIVCFGKKSGSFVSKKVDANAKYFEFVEKNKREWRSEAFRNANGLAVVVMSHPSIADWTKSHTDPTVLIERILKVA